MEPRGGVYNFSDFSYTPRMELNEKQLTLLTHTDARVQELARRLFAERLAPIREADYYALVVEATGGEENFWKQAAEKALRDAEAAIAKQDAEARTITPARARYNALIKAGVKPCVRCGGAGGAQKWPGFTCYRCGGSGIDPRQPKRRRN